MNFLPVQRDCNSIENASVGVLLVAVYLVRQCEDR